MSQSEPSNRLTLLEAAREARFEVARDASFANLAFVSSPLPSMLAFAESERFLKLALRLDAVSAIITRPELGDHVPPTIGLALADDPRLAFGELHNHLALETRFYGAKGVATQVMPGSGVHPMAFVAESDVVLGPRCVIGAHASVLSGSTLSNDVVVQEGAVVGGTGLQVEQTAGRTIDLEHAGRVEIGEGVRIMANSVVARGLFRQPTVIGPNVRIGNLSFVSHNVEIGPGTIVGHGVTINGNVCIGRDVWIGPGATIANGVHIGDRAHVSLGSTVVRNVIAEARVSGNFSVDHRTFLRRQSRQH